MCALRNSYASSHYKCSLCFFTVLVRISKASQQNMKNKETLPPGWPWSRAVAWLAVLHFWRQNGLQSLRSVTAGARVGWLGRRCQRFYSCRIPDITWFIMCPVLLVRLLCRTGDCVLHPHFRLSGVLKLGVSTFFTLIVLFLKKYIGIQIFSLTQNTLWLSLQSKRTMK